MKKRVLSAFLVCVMLLSLLPVAHAEGIYQVVTLDKTSVKAGETVHVQVTLPNISETAGSFTVLLCRLIRLSLK